MGLLGIQDRECFAVRMYVEHAVALEIPSALPGFGRRRLGTYTGPKKYPEQGNRIKEEFLRKY